MKLQKIKVFFSFFFVLSIIYIFFVHTNIMSISNIVGETYTPSDTEINYVSTLNTFYGNGLYKSFSNVYPPGRFLLQAVFFKLFGVSIPTSRLYFALPELLFPVLIFFLSFLIFRKYKPLVFSSLLAISTTLIYLFFINSSQDVHIFEALFFIALLSKFRSENLKNIILGILLGIVFLFRIEAGIFLLLSIVVVLFKNKKNYKKLYPALYSFLGVWIPVLIYILYTGSIKNFIYDTLYPGLVVQPKLIDLPIPPHLSYVFFAILVFLFSASLSLYIKSRNQIEIKVFALFSIMSFVAALVRSDEGHLWYAAVWLPVYISYLILQISHLKKYISKNMGVLIIPLCIALYAFGYFIIKIKSAFLFILLTTVIFWFFTKKLKKDYSFLILISGIITTLFIFHSLSFLKLKFTGLPKVSFEKTFVHGLFKSDGEEIAGLKFSKSTLTVLNKIKKRLDPNKKLLFIYPNHVIFYYYFKYKNPTRYYYFAVGTTNEIQKEIITILEKTKTNNFIFFPNQPTNQKIVKQWIIKNTYIDQVYMLGNERIELRKIQL